MQDTLVEIGYVIRTHGVKGHLRIAFDTFCKELSVSEALYFFVKGVYLPHFIAEISYFQNGDALVLLEEIHVREEADLHTKKPVFGPKDWLAEPDTEEESFVGYRIEDDRFGHLGEIVAESDMGSYWLLTVQSAEKEILIPLHEHLIRMIDEESATIFTQLPEGLTEL